jgi:hypothetical protein
MKKKYVMRNGEKVVAFDISKDFNKFVKKNEKLLKKLSKI